MGLWGVWCSVACRGVYGIFWGCVDVGGLMVLYVNVWGCRVLYGVVWAVGDAWNYMGMYGGVGCGMGLCGL